MLLFLFFFNDTATTEIYTLSLHDALPIWLLQAVFPDAWPQLEDTAQALGQLGILKRMESIGGLLWQALGQAGWQRCLTHRSDTVRGWACFMAGAQPGLTLSQRLELLQPLADDSHFGVREWSWMGVRPHLASDLPQDRKSTRLNSSHSQISYAVFC